jgi:hypothetical protein
VQQQRNTPSTGVDRLAQKRHTNVALQDLTPGYRA